MFPAPFEFLKFIFLLIPVRLLDQDEANHAQNQHDRVSEGSDGVHAVKALTVCFSPSVEFDDFVDVYEGGKDGLEQDCQLQTQ